MNYATVCSGIEAPSQAWHGLGWNPVWFSEIEPFPCAVLKHHHPTVPNLGDMTKLHEKEIYIKSDIDLLCGGTPCQSFSYAGLRQGLADERGNLALQFIRILAEKRPAFFVWENVPGVLSSASGSDFAAILGGFTGRNIAIPKNGWKTSGIIEGIPDAYGIAWTVLDAQYFGVPQRRRRIFFVGYIGDWRPAAAVLFDPESLSGHPAPERETREGTASCLTARAKGGSGGDNFRGDGTDNLIIGSIDGEKNGFIADGPTGTLNIGSRSGSGQQPCVVMATGQPNAEIVKDGSPSLTCNHETPILFGLPGNWIGRKPENGGNQTEPFHDLSPCLTKTDQHAVAFGWQNSEHQGDNVGEICPTLDKSKTPAVFQPRIARNGRGALSETAYPLTAEAEKTGTGDTAQCVVCFAQNSRDELREMNVAGALSAQPGMKQQSYLRQLSVIRRFTPLECERLQGFPDNFTRIPMREYPAPKYTKLRPADRWDGNTLMAADGPRYRAIGNSMAVPVMRWIGERIDLVNKIINNHVKTIQ